MGLFEDAVTGGILRNTQAHHLTCLSAIARTLQKTCRSRNSVAVETRALRRHLLTLLTLHNGGEDLPLKPRQHVLYTSVSFYKLSRTDFYTLFRTLESIN
jgi:hypothetical protein